MSRRSSYYYKYEYFPHFSQPTVGELRANAQKTLQDAGQKGRVYNPVHPKGNSRSICVTWWGQSWCQNMERYSDYSNRLPRGRYYVNSGTILDLQILNGEVQALVQGSRSTPYRITIRIDPLSPASEAAILEKCNRKLRNVEDLIYGRFPDDLKELFLARGGLFPSPSEIHMSCSCPDWAVMCKHVAATMYGIGVRLDDNPFFFFTLRGINVDDFVSRMLADKVDSMLSHADVRTDRMIPEEDISELFGVL